MPIYKETIHQSDKEPRSDVVRVLGTMFRAIAFRGYRQSDLLDIARWAGVPVYNCLTDQYHPTQALADLMTIQERFSTLRRTPIAYLGDACNNVARSLAIAAAKTGMSLRFAAPSAYRLDEETVRLCDRYAKESGGSIRVDDTIEAAVTGAKAVYTDVWVSMGDDSSQSSQRHRDLSPFQVNSAVMSLADPDAVFCHCLPATRGNEVTAEVIDGRQSVVWRQAGQRKYAILALLELTLEPCAG